MKRLLSLILVGLAVCSFSVSAQTAQQILDKAVAKINGAKAIECSFTVSGQGQSVKGTMLVSGNKFKLTTPQGTTWFDGSKMWTANKSTKEITLVKPTDQEVRESNPFSYINGYKSTYNVFFSKARKDKDFYLVLLNPKKKNHDIKAVEIAISKTSLLPERFIIRDRKDHVTTLKISSLSLKNATKADAFSCPVGQMSDYELIDLQ